MDDKIYHLSLAGVVDVALQPIKSFKDILIRLDENGLRPLTLFPLASSWNPCLKRQSVI